MKLETKSSRRAWFLGAVLCLAASTACEDSTRTLAPVAEPEFTEGMDPFVLEAMVPHVAAAKADPSNAELRARLGLFYESNKMWALAADSFEVARTLDSSRPEWLFHLANMRLLEGKSSEARQHLSELRSTYPRFAPGRFRGAVLHFQDGDFDAARTEFEEVARLEPRCFEARVSIAEILVHQGQPEKALRILDEVAAAVPTYMRTQYVRGLALRDLGRIDEADIALHKGLDAKRLSLTDPLAGELQKYRAGYEALNGVAVGMIREGRNAEAIPILEKVLAKIPGDAPTANNISVAYRALGQTDKAAEVLQRSHEENPTHFPTLINLSGCRWEQGRFEESLRLANKALELVPENGRAHFCKARALLRLEDSDEAIKELYLSLRYDPTQPMVHAVLAQELQKQGRHEEAEELWKTMLEKAPGTFLGLYNLVKCQLRIGKRAEAQNNFNKLKAVAPNREEVKALAKEFGQ